MSPAEQVHHIRVILAGNHPDREALRRITLICEGQLKETA